MKKRLISFILAAMLIFSLLPMSALAAETSNKCGDNLTWSLNNLVLTISGTGKMNDYSSLFKAPWYSSRLLISSVVIEDGVTSIGSSAFLNCFSMTKITIPASVTSIGKNAFDGCRLLSNITYGGTEKQWQEVGIASGNDKLTASGISYAEHVHDYAAVVTEPTCTEKGYTTYTCACGDSYTGDETAALGHSYVNGECSRCHDVVIAITKQPADLKAKSGTTGKFTITASGEGLTYQWQYQKTGSSAWTNSTAKSAATATLSVSAREAINGYKYRCVIKDSKGNSAASSTAKLSVTANITKQPANLKAKSGTTGKFTITASGEGLTYQWQYQKPGGSWTNSTAKSATSATFSVSVRSAINGYKYRCIVTNSCGNSVTSSTVTLTVTPAITKQPANLKAKSGTTGKFSVTADGVGLTYKWQYLKPGGSWTNSTAKSATTATLSVSVRSAINGYKYRCIVKDTNGNSVTSSTATLTVK